MKGMSAVSQQSSTLSHPSQAEFQTSRSSTNANSPVSKSGGYSIKAGLEVALDAIGSTKQ